MKKLLLLFVALLAASSVFGQDLIITFDSKEIEAKVIEVTDSTIKYRRFSNPDGPIYNIARRDVVTIKYENGETEGFSGAGELRIRKNSRYTIGGTRFSRNQVLKIVAPYDDVVKNIRAGVRMKKAAIATGCVGGGIAVVGVLIMMGATGYDDLNEDIVNVGLAVWGGGIILGLPSIGLGIGSVKAQKKAMRLYNEYTGYAEIPGRAPSLAVAFTPGGVGLQLNF